MVVTPFFPYRDCMPVFRYDTRDVVRRLPDEPLTCNLAGVPALSPILGKAGQLLRHRSTGVVTPRDIVEVLEALPAAAMAGPVPGRRRRRRAPPHHPVGHRRRHHDRRDRPPLRRPRHRLRHRRRPTPTSRCATVRADLAETTFTTDRTPAGV